MQKTSNPNPDLQSGNPDEDQELLNQQQHLDSVNNDEQNSSSAYTCGLSGCLKKCLSVLPYIGDDEDENSDADFEALRQGAKQIIQLIVPVTLCMAVVVLFELSIVLQESENNEYFVYTPFNEGKASSGGQTFLFALLNALIVVAIVVVMTVVLVLLFKYRCYRAIQVWLLVASGSLLFFFSTLYCVEILEVHNLASDWISFVLLIWNFGAVGLIVIHWKGPLRLQQAYLIVTSALVATRFLKYLPPWTTWVLLAAIAIYDLVAVLCPKGPLRVLVETAKERNEPLFPSLIYSSTMVWIVGMADNNKPACTAGENKDGSSIQQNVDGDTSNSPASGGSEEDDDKEPRGFKLGLGDFIFYSILVGKAAHDSDGDWVIISSCFVAILIGLCMTSLILGIVRRALPALPISILFGLLFYFSSQYLIAPFVSVLATTQVYI
jgi:hypothetical protein